MERFEIGEVAVFIGDSPYVRSGTEVIVRSEEREHLDAHRIGYSIEVPGLLASSRTGYWFCRSESLRKKPKAPERECDRVVSWDDCAWRPIETATIG